MRDRRFVAVHRGGPLDLARHRLLAEWAASCAQHVLSHFTSSSKDDRPQRAIEIARAWARGEVPVGAAQKASVASHAAARAAPNPAACAAARAAGHAVATAHMAEHSLGAALYALKALTAAGAETRPERAWQIRQLPGDVKDLVVSALEGERFKRFVRP
jgi:hypothetical protein